ncbi:MAG: YdcF family protein [Pseudorhodoplanes sp.]
MPAVETQTVDHGFGKARLRGLIRALRFFVAGAAIGVLVTVGGFLWFLDHVSPSEIELSDRADGIVVLTGGASRIEDAIELLARGNGRRLLVSGVNPQTSDRAIARLRPEHATFVACCVDLDRTAVNTLTNATETRRWAKERGFQSLIVVTSNYHMPRAMAELSHQLPGIALIGFPVVSDRLKAGWTNGPVLRLLFTEYVKYMVAVARMRVPAIDRMFA